MPLSTGMLPDWDLPQLRTMQSTPLLLSETENGLHLSIHEAALLDYAGMTLKVDTVNLKMTSQLVGSDRMAYKVKRTLPFKTPWRSLQISDEAKDLIESKLIVNLNDANKLGNISWFKQKNTWAFGGKCTLLLVPLIMA